MLNSECLTKCCGRTPFEGEPICKSWISQCLNIFQRNWIPSCFWWSGWNLGCEGPCSQEFPLRSGKESSSMALDQESKQVVQVLEGFFFFFTYMQKILYYLNHFKRINSSSLTCYTLIQGVRCHKWTGPRTSPIWQLEGNLTHLWTENYKVPAAFAAVSL